MASMAEMKQLRQIAESYYEASSLEMKAKANNFFKSMDHDGDNKVGLEEFLTFMKSHGYAHMKNKSFFEVLDGAGRGALSFMDVMTLYYIIKSARPFCDSCSDFIPGIFFSCVHCFNANPKSAFDICHRCYKSKKCKHSHDGSRGGALFLDNYTLLQATRHSSTAPTFTRPEIALSRNYGQLSREEGLPTSPSRRHGKSPREDVLAVSGSDDFATRFMKIEFNNKVAQSASKNVATPPDSIRYYASNSLRRRTQDPAPSTTMFPANQVKINSNNVSNSLRQGTQDPAPSMFAATSATMFPASQLKINSNYGSNSLRRGTQGPAPSTAIVPATGPPKRGVWTEVASVSFKALDKMIVVGNVVGVVVTAVSACTIM